MVTTDPAPVRPPDILVIITGGGTPRAVSATLRSLTAQADVTFETARIENTAEGLEAARDAVGASRAAFVTFARVGDVLLPGALRAICTAMLEPARPAMAHVLFVPLDQDGAIDGAAARAHAVQLRRHPPRYRGHDPVLPTFRRDALCAPHGLAGGSLDEAVGAAAGRAHERRDAQLMARVWCARPRSRRHGLARVARQAADATRRWLDWSARAARRLISVALGAPLVGPLIRAGGPYAALSALLQPWPIAGLRLERPRVAEAGGARVAYVLWRYPLFSDTFIRREVHGVRATGLAVEIVAFNGSDPPIPDDPACPAGPATHVDAEGLAEGRAFVLARLRRQPLTIVRLWLFFVRHPYPGDKTWWRDRDLLYLSGKLAAVLERLAVSRVHAPWADRLALVSFGAARLLGLPFSVQARASEIHRVAETPAIADRVRFAEFVVTNSRYNERYLRSKVPAGATPPIHVVYEGIDLPRFRPDTGWTRRDGPLRLLSVARLVEPKGLEHLLRACYALRARGHDIACDVIGGSEPFDTATWVRLRMLHAELGLAPSVQFHGAQRFSVVLDAMQRADLVVLPCVRARDGSHDITPNSLMEAMALARPVISTTSGAIAEIVDHEVNGLLVPPGDEPALVEAIARLAEDCALRTRLGRAARQKIELRFDISRNAADLARLFRSRTTA